MNSATRGHQRRRWNEEIASCDSCCRCAYRGHRSGVGGRRAKEQPGMNAGPATKAEPEMKKGADIKSGAEQEGRDHRRGAWSNKADPKAEPTTTGQASEPKARTPKAKPSTTGQASEPKAPSPSRVRRRSRPPTTRRRQRSRATNEKAGSGRRLVGAGHAGASGELDRAGQRPGRRVGQPDDRAEEHDPHHGAAVEQRAEGVAEPDQLQHQRRHGGAAQRRTS